MESSFLPGRDTEVKLKLNFNAECLVMRISTNTKFEQLAQKVDARVSKFTDQSIQAGSLRLYYKDVDCERIWIDGDEALEEALSEQLMMPSSSLINAFNGPSVHFDLKTIADASNDPLMSRAGITSISTSDNIWGDVMQHQDTQDNDLNQVTSIDCFPHMPIDAMDVDEDLPPMDEFFSFPSDTSSPSMGKQSAPVMILDQRLPEPLVSTEITQRNQLQPGSSRYTRLTTEQKFVLQAWYNTHNEYPYPTKLDLDVLSAQTQLEVSRIKNWFCRARQKDSLRPEESQSPSNNGNDNDNDNSREHDHFDPLARHSINDRRQSLESAMEMASLDVGAASPFALSSSRMSGCSEDALRQTWSEVGDMPPEADTLNVNDDRLAGREHEKLEWWLDQLMPIDPLTILPSLMEAEASLASKEDLDSYKPGELPDSLHPTRWRASVRSETSSGARSQHMSASSTVTGQSACSYNSYGRRRGRRRPRRIVIEREKSSEKEMFPTSIRSRSSSLHFGSIFEEEPLAQTQQLQQVFNFSDIILNSGIGHASKIVIEKDKHVCAACGARFTRKTTLKRHHGAVHDPKAFWFCAPRNWQLNCDGNLGVPVSCYFCTSRPQLWGQCHHRPQSCLTASPEARKFYRKDNFKEHLKIHGVTSEELKGSYIQQFECKLLSSGTKYAHDRNAMSPPSNVLSLIKDGSRRVIQSFTRILDHGAAELVKKSRNRQPCPSYSYPLDDTWDQLFQLSYPDVVIAKAPK